MKKVLLSGLFIASTLTAFAPNANAANIVLDDFTDSEATSFAITGTLTNADVPGFPATPPGGPANFVNGSDNPQIEAGGLGAVPSVISRFITGARTAGAGSNDVGIEVGTGVFELNNGSNADSDVTIVWDNRTTAAPGPGLGLTIPANAEFFYVNVIDADLGLTENDITLDLIINGLAAASSQPITDNIDNTLTTYLWPIGPLALAPVNDVELRITGFQAYDIRIDEVGIQQATPEPSALLGLAAIASLAVFAKKGKA